MKNFLTLVALVVSFIGALAAAPAFAQQSSNAASCCAVSEPCCDSGAPCCLGAVEGLQQAAVGASGLAAAAVSKASSATADTKAAAECCPGACCETAAPCCG